MRLAITVKVASAVLIIVKEYVSMLSAFPSVGAEPPDHFGVHTVSSILYAFT